MSYILITGSAKGLGRKIALELATRGHNVVIHYRKSQKEAEKLALECREKGVKAEITAGDFSHGASTFIQTYLEKNLPTKGLVNNVGDYFLGPLSKTPPDQWRYLFECNLHAPFELTMGLFPSLKKERGAVVNIGCSGVQSIKANLHSSAYRATKLGLAFMTVSLAKEWAKEGITVNMVSPGHLENSVDLPSQGNFPMGRAGRLDEVAKMVAFFFEKESEYITGQNIEVAGGYGL